MRIRGQCHGGGEEGGEEGRWLVDAQGSSSCSQTATLFLLPQLALVPTFITNFGGKVHILKSPHPGQRKSICYVHVPPRPILRNQSIIEQLKAKLNGLGLIWKTDTRIWYQLQTRIQKQRLTTTHIHLEAYLSYRLPGCDPK